MFWTDYSGSGRVLFLLSVLIIPFTIGLLDDLVHLKPVAKLITQLLTASLLFFFLDLRLTSFYNLFGPDVLPQGVSYAATLITVVIITNSLNLIDGIDGLAAVFSLTGCLIFGTWFFVISNNEYALLCFAISGAILAFLFQNWEPSKIFMGDTGSLVIGTVLSILTIQFINDNHRLDEGHPFKFQSSVGTAICIIIIPLVDTFRIIIIRLRKGFSPFVADKRHIHHGLVRLNLSHRQAVSVLTLAHILFITLALIMRKSQDWLLIGTIAIIAAVLCVILEKALGDLYSKKTKPAGNKEAQ
jgi:UDP-GlcNAc:undecaprenyl-phosphate/decaprenyl-phosphate GlcNAc-1-phosphate transferase